MNKRTKVLIATAATLALAGVGGTMAVAGGSEENDKPITGDALTRASAAALKVVPGGTVTETEVGDEESLYEVEVTKAGGGEVDVQLDENFRVVGQQGDDGEQDEGDER